MVIETNIRCVMGLMPLAHAPATAQEWALVLAFHLMVVGVVASKVPHAGCRRVGIAGWAVAAPIMAGVLAYALLTR